MPRRQSRLSYNQGSLRTEPYQYLCGFGNHHATEAVMGALPRHGTNLPQRHPLGLCAEHMNGTPFISSREAVSNVYVSPIRLNLDPCHI